MLEINFIIAFVSGLLTFFSACLIPIVPAYIAYIAGVSLAEFGEIKHTDIQLYKKLKYRIVKNSIFFILGFSLIFILLGLTATSIGLFLTEKRIYLQKFGGIFMIVLGLFLVGFIKIPFFYKEYKFKTNKINKPIVINSFLVGTAFAFSWTPCISPILSGILFLASLSGTMWEGALLLSFFAIGLAIPFILIAFTIGHSIKMLSKISKYSTIIKYITGIIIVIIGTLMILGLWENLISYFIELFDY